MNLILNQELYFFCVGEDGQRENQLQYFILIMENGYCIVDIIPIRCDSNLNCFALILDSLLNYFYFLFQSFHLLHIMSNNNYFYHHLSFAAFNSIILIQFEYINKVKLKFMEASAESNCILIIGCILLHENLLQLNLLTLLLLSIICNYYYFIIKSS